MGAQVIDPQILKDPRVKMAFIVIGVAILLYLLTGSWLSNIRSSDKTIQNNFASLKQNCEQRIQIIPQFIQLFTYYAPQAQDLKNQLQQVYTKTSSTPINENILTDQQSMQAFISSQMEVAAALSLMMVQAKNYPTLAQNRQYSMLVMQLLSLEQQIEYMTVLVNQSIIIHNNLLTGFPKNWLNSLFVGEKERLLVEVPTFKQQQNKPS
ncbi:MAG: LemA family protein [Proteobacteria bacterium]|nr:LemA family protein [Pseudomonadota bacterium]